MDIFILLGAAYSEARSFLLHVVIAAICGLLSLPKRLTTLRYLASGTIISRVYFTLLVLIEAPYYIAQQETLWEDVSYWNLNVSGCNAVAIIIFANSNIALVPTIYRELANRSYERGIKVIDRGMIITTVLYVTFGVVGYFSYINDIPDVVFDRNRHGNSIDWPMLVGKGLFGASLIATYVLNLHPLRDTVETMITGIHHTHNEGRLYKINFILVVLIGITGTISERVVDYFKILGGCISVFLSVIVPTMLFWKIPGELKYKVLITLWTVILSLLGLISAMSVILGYHS